MNTSNNKTLAIQRLTDFICSTYFCSTPKHGVVSPSLTKMFAKNMREWLMVSFHGDGEYDYLFARKVNSNRFDFEMDGFEVFTRELGKKEKSSERLAWLKSFHAEEAEPPPWQGWGMGDGGWGMGN